MVDTEGLHRRCGVVKIDLKNSRRSRDDLPTKTVGAPNLRRTSKITAMDGLAIEVWDGPRLVIRLKSTQD